MKLHAILEPGLQRQTVTTQMHLQTRPQFLLIHLKRFHVERGDKPLVRKLEAHIAYPLRDLSVTAMHEHHDEARDSQATAAAAAAAAAAAGDDDAELYDLVATINHFGSVGMGHYTALVRRAPDEWYHCDDSFVDRIAEPDAAHAANGVGVYCLLYQRRDLASSSQTHDDKNCDRDSELVEAHDHHQ